MAQPSGYMNRRIPQSVEEAAVQYSADSIKTIVKATLQKYIESFLAKSGGNRKLFEALSREGLKFAIEESFDGSKNPDMRKLQVARLFEQLRQELPAILIADNAFEFVPTNWTGVDAVSADNDFIYSRLSIMRKLGISIVAGARDRSTIDMLQSLLSVLFGEARFKAQGNRITGNYTQGENWVVCLCPPILGSVSQQAVADDPKDQIYTFNIELSDVLFEDSILIKEPRPEIPFLNTGIANPENGDLSNVLPEIIVGDTIKINEQTPVRFRLLQAKVHSFRVSNPNICTFEPRECILNPRRLGEFELQIVRTIKNVEATTASVEVVTSKTIRVVP